MNSLGATSWESPRKEQNLLTLVDINSIEKERAFRKKQKIDTAHNRKLELSFGEYIFVTDLHLYFIKYDCIHIMTFVAVSAVHF